MRRRPGRPRRLDRDAALRASIDQFWRHGYGGVDLDRIARAAGGTKPSLYELFGDKRGLFREALRHYGATTGAAPVVAFVGAPTVAAAVESFLATAVEGQTEPGCPTGCLFACVAAPEAALDEGVRTILFEAWHGGEDLIAARFKEAIDGDELPAAFPASERAHLLIDLMQACALRARAGESREMLLQAASYYAALVLAG